MVGISAEPSEDKAPGVSREFSALLKVQEGRLPSFFAEHLHCVRLRVRTDTLIVMVLEGQVGRGQHQGIKG